MKFLLIEYFTKLFLSIFLSFVIALARNIFVKHKDK